MIVPNSRKNASSALTFFQGSHRTNLKVIKGGYRDGKEWATQVRECAEGEEPDVRGLDIETLMLENGLDSIDLLKVDIEGAETKVFSDVAAWIHAVGTIMIELHEPPAEAVFLEAVAKSNRFVLITDRELTIASSTIHLQQKSE